MSYSAIYDPPSGQLDARVNYIPTAITLPAWRQFRSERERSLERFQTESARRSRSLRTYPALIEARQKVLDRVSGILHPIRVCSDDVLRLIFEAYYLATHETLRFYIARHLVAVCAKWRQVGLSTPLLWSHVSCLVSNRVNVEFWDFMVTSVKSVGISIWLVVIDGIPPSLFTQFDRFPFVKRISISLQSNDPSGYDVSPPYMSTLLARAHLNMVSITGQQKPRVVVQLDRIYQDVPRLRRLHVNCNVILRSPATLNLPTLVCIKIGPSVAGVQPLALLTSCPQIVYFSATSVGFLHESGDSILTHGALTRLAFTACTGTHEVLRRISAPCLERWKSEVVVRDFLVRHAPTLRRVRFLTRYSSENPETISTRINFEALASSAPQITSLTLPEPFLVLMNGARFPSLVDLTVRCSFTTDFLAFGAFATGLADGVTSVRSITLVGSMEKQLVWEEIGVHGEDPLPDLDVHSPTLLGLTSVRMMESRE